MGIARSTYYDEPAFQPIGEARLVEQIKAVCAEWPAYGYRRVTAELHDEGRIVSHKKVMRLMKEKRPDRAATPANCEPPSRRAGRHRGASTTPRGRLSSRFRRVVRLPPIAAPHSDPEIDVNGMDRPCSRPEPLRG